MTRRGDGSRTRPPWAPATLVALLIVVAIGCIGRDASQSAPASAGPTPPPLKATAAPSRSPSAAHPSKAAMPTPSAATPAPSRAPTASPSLPHEDGELEALLPSSIAGIPLTRFSVPGSFFTAGSDMCILVCGDEPTRYAKELGIPVDRITVAFATDERLSIGMIAYRARDVATGRLIPARIAIGGYSGHAHGFTWPVAVGGRAATYLAVLGLERGEYLVAIDDVLFIVLGESPTRNGSFAPDGGTIPAQVVEAFAGLP